MISDPWFYLTAIPAVLIYAVGKGGLGGGLGVVAVPLMTLTTAPTQAAAVMLPILCVMDIFAVRHHARNCDRQQLAIMFPAALLGIVIAAFFLKVTPDYGLKLLIGILSLLFSLQYVFASTSRPPAGRLGGYFWSCLGGFSSTAIHAGGGPISIYLLPQQLDKMRLVGTMAVLFAGMNFIKLIPYSWLGQFDSTNLITALVLSPLAPIGVKLGVWLFDRVSQQVVYRLCYTFLFVSGLKLSFDGLYQLWW